MVSLLSTPCSVSPPGLGLATWSPKFGLAFVLGFPSTSIFTICILIVTFSIIMMMANLIIFFIMILTSNLFLGPKGLLTVSFTSLPSTVPVPTFGELIQNLFRPLGPSKLGLSS